MVQYVFKINQIEITLVLTNPSKYMIMLRYHEALEKSRLGNNWSNTNCQFSSSNYWLSSIC